MVGKAIAFHRQIMEKYGYPKDLEQLQQKYKAGEMTPEKNTVLGKLRAPAEKELFHLPKEGRPEYREMLEAGENAVRNSEVGVVILNGGMATRFGGCVKGTLEVFGGKSFLELKILNVKKIAKKYNSKIPVFVMNSFQTEEATERFFAEHKNFGYDNVHFFNQLISIRLDEKGDVFYDDKGRPSFYGPGHGDFHYAFINSGLLDKFINDGGKYLFLANLDNLGATLDPLVIGFHILKGEEMTIEVADNIPGHKGGYPAVLNGKLQIIEHYRFPREIDQDDFVYSNANSFVFNAESLKKECELDWFVAVKDIGGKKIIQFERLIGQMSAHLMCACLIVPSAGLHARFIPAKTEEALEQNREYIKEAMMQRI